MELPLVSYLGRFELMKSGPWWISHIDPVMSHCQVITRHVSIQMKRLKVVEFIRCLDLKYCEGIGPWIVLVLYLCGCVMVIMNNIHIFFIINLVVLVPKFPPPSSYWTGLHQLVDNHQWLYVDHWWCGISLLGWLVHPTSIWVPVFSKEGWSRWKNSCQKLLFFHNQESRPKIRIPKVRLRNWILNIYTTAKKTELTNDIKTTQLKDSNNFEHQPYRGLFLQRDPQERCTLGS